MISQTTTMAASVLSAALFLFAPNKVSSATEFRTVALSAQHAPGTPVATKFLSFPFPPSLNNAGQVAFQAFLTNDGASLSTKGIWSEGSGALALVAFEGMQAPDAPVGVEFLNLARPVLSDSGQVAFGGFATGTSPGPSYSGVWTEQAGDVQAVILQGNQAPGAPTGVNFRSLINGIVVTNASGDIASKFRVDGIGIDSTNDIGIWSTSSGTLGLVALEGNQVPGTPSGVLFNSIETPVLNDAGEVAFSASITGSGSQLTPDGIWLGAPGNVQLIVREGNDAPGTSNGAEFFSFSDPVLNESGEIAFRGIIVGNGVDTTNNFGIWVGSPGNLQLAAREGSHARGTPSDVEFGNIGSRSPVLNALGQIAFRARLRGNGVDDTNGLGIWSGTPGNVQLLAREGSHAPGTPSDDVVFSGLSFPALNAVGQIAFTSGLSGPGIDPSTNGVGFWATDLQGNLHLVARAGDAIEVSPGDSRTISGFSFENNPSTDDRRPSGFNDRGQIAFLASFTDGSSGIIVSDLVAVPEPTSLVFAGVSFLSALCGSRQR